MGGRSEGARMDWKPFRGEGRRPTGERVRHMSRNAVLLQFRSVRDFSACFGRQEK
jgi:hypothetical protein